MEWLLIGDAANIVQLSITMNLIKAILRAAKHARMHKRNCRQFAQHMRLIANLLQQLKPQDVDEFPEYRETREPLDALETTLKGALTLVQNCRDKSYLYLIAMGWSIVNQFKQYQDEIDKYLRLIPLITLVENHKEKLRAIERDRRDYTLDEEEKRIFTTLLKDKRSRDDRVVLQKSVSRSYPGLSVERALEEENHKLRKELTQTQRDMDLDGCDVIEHLLEITKTVSIPEEEQEKYPLPGTHSRASTMDSLDIGLIEAVNAAPPQRVASRREVFPSRVPSFREDYPSRVASLRELPQQPLPPPPPPPPPPRRSAPPLIRQPTKVVRQSPMVTPMRTPMRSPRPPARLPIRSPMPYVNNGRAYGNELGITPEERRWHNGLCDCCADPFLCISTFLYPCGTFTNIASVVTDGQLTQEMACHDLAFHSLYCGCCCFTCCYRRKLRKKYRIPGGSCDDCWAHFCCCCCSLIQEWREVQLLEEEGLKMYKMRVPSQQTMENYRQSPFPVMQERYQGYR